MKKAFFFVILAVLAVSSYAEDLPNRRIFIAGSSVNHEHLEYFLTNFNAEALGTGYSVTENIADAGYIFKFNVTNNPDAGDVNKYIIRISLINNTTGADILYFDFFYSGLEEMYEYNQFLFLKAVTVIPPIDLDAILAVDSRWRNKWIYVRASFDYPISFYELLGTGLNGTPPIAVYEGEFDNPTRMAPIDNRLIALPGFTVGAEFQFLDFMSMEANLRAHFGDPETNKKFNLGAGLQLKFPLKFFKNFVIAPYGSALFPLLKSDVFSGFPVALVGGGLQLSVKGGKSGAVFLDVNYMMSVKKDAEMENPYGELYPKPERIHYRYSALGIGAGYKYGFIDRKKKAPKGVNICTSCDCRQPNCNCSGCGGETSVREEFVPDWDINDRSESRRRNVHVYYF